jgi:hypothetical protein
MANKSKCPACDGAGRYWAEELHDWRVCNRCIGRGWVDFHAESGNIIRHPDRNHGDYAPVKNRY